MNKPLRQTFWAIGYTLSALAAIALAATVGFVNGAALLISGPPAGLGATLTHAPAPSFDPRKPTVAIVLGNTRTVSSDFLLPYAMFAESGAYNVYAVAETRELRTLTGGVDVLPHYSFAELAALLGRSPDMIVVPAIRDTEKPQNAPVRGWLRQHAQGQTVVFSWCTGAEVLAASGLIDGKTVTTHWGDIDRLERTYPAARWQRGERYIDAGMLITTGGITSGVDATLHVIARRNGPAVAGKVARALRYPASPFAASTHMAQYATEAADGILLLNLAFNWPKPQAGVWLYNGVSEADLGAIDDVYQMSSAYQTATVAAGESVISQHGLQIVPRWHSHTLPAMDRLLLPGGNGAEQAAASLPPELGGVPITRLQNDHAPAYVFTTALRDLAASHDLPSATFAAKRLEVRGPLQLTGTQWPLHLLAIPLLAGLAGAAAFGGAAWLLRRAIRSTRTHKLASAPRRPEPRAVGS